MSYWNMPVGCGWRTAEGQADDTPCDCGGCGAEVERRDLDEEGFCEECLELTSCATCGRELEAHKLNKDGDCEPCQFAKEENAAAR